LEVELTRSPLFSALDSSAADSLRQSMVEIKINKGNSIFREGEPGDKLYLVIEGKIKLSSKSPDGREAVQAVLGPGDMFGELSLFDPGPRASSAIAVTDAKCAGLSHDSLQPWLRERPEVAESLLRALANRLRRTNEALADLVFNDVPGRVAKALCGLGQRFGKNRDDGLLVAHDLTQEELAQLVGASRETVNKALADFSSRGWIKIEPRRVVIIDTEKLAKRAR
jgi:CRP/FNR family transcriptional regulator